MLIHTWSAWSPIPFEPLCFEKRLFSRSILRGSYFPNFLQIAACEILKQQQILRAAIIYSAASKERTSEFSRKTLLFLYGPIAMLFQLFGTYYILIYFNYAKSISNTQTLCVTFHIRLQRVSHTVTVNIHLVCNVGPNLSPQFELC